LKPSYQVPPKGFRGAVREAKAQFPEDWGFPNPSIAPIIVGFVVSGVPGTKTPGGCVIHTTYIRGPAQAPLRSPGCE